MPGGQVRDLEGENIHFGQGAAITIADLAATCLRVLNVDAKIFCEPERMRPAESEVDLLVCDPSKAQRLLGWKPQVTLEDGLRLTADYLRSRLSSYEPSIYAV